MSGQRTGTSSSSYANRGVYNHAQQVPQLFDSRSHGSGHGLPGYNGSHEVVHAAVAHVLDVDTSNPPTFDSMVDQVNEPCPVPGCKENVFFGAPTCAKHYPQAERYRNAVFAMHNNFASPQTPSTPSTNATSPPTTPSSGSSSRASRSPAKAQSTAAPRKAYTKTLAATDAGSLQWEPGYIVQCRLTYNERAPEELRGKPCGRWFKNSDQLLGHVKGSNNFGHNLLLGKAKTQDYEPCLWDGCVSAEKQSGLREHIVKRHLFLQYQCKICSAIMQHRKNAINLHFQNHHETTGEAPENCYREVPMAHK
ncbi:hypothetical protein CPC08DRAFT_767986 [Agrocybe pediades]|nr:hypothetical protein CPC08DRAFT_767986 [Agrocybe pediades]